MQSLSQNHYRDFLLEAFESRAKKNPHYSMRAFARDLQLSPSRLHDVIKGRYGLSCASAEKIAAKLGFSKSETEIFCASVESQHARGAIAKKAAQKKLKLLRARTLKSVIAEETFKLISEWHHFAILELATIKGFDSSIGFIEKKLGLQRMIAQRAVKRLLDLKLLVKNGKRLQPTDERNATIDEVPSSAIKNFHAQSLDLAKQALWEQPIDQREFRTSFLAIDRAKLPAAKESLKRFIREFCSEASESDAKDCVYALGIQFYELTKTKGK